MKRDWIPTAAGIVIGLVICLGLGIGSGLLLRPHTAPDNYEAQSCVVLGPGWLYVYDGPLKSSGVIAASSVHRVASVRVCGADPVLQGTDGRVIVEPQPVVAVTQPGGKPLMLSDAPAIWTRHRLANQRVSLP